MLIKKFLRIIFNSVLGALALYVVNIIGVNFNFHVGLNWYTVIGTGILGIPGVVLIIVMKCII